MFAMDKLAVIYHNSYLYLDYYYKKFESLKKTEPPSPTSLRDNIDFGNEIYNDYGAIFWLYL